MYLSTSFCRHRVHLSRFMCIYIYTCIYLMFAYICVYACLHAHTRTHTHTSMYTSLYLSTYLPIYLSVHPSIYLSIGMYANRLDRHCAHMQTEHATDTQAHICIHFYNTYIYSLHIYMHTHRFIYI